MRTVAILGCAGYAGQETLEVADCLERGLLVGTAGERALRLTPPLTVSPAELEHGLLVLREVLA